MRKILIATVIAATALPSTMAYADPPRWAPAHGWRAKNGDIEYRRTDNGIRYWRGEDGRSYCRRPDGTVGLLIGGAAGALVGRAIDTEGDRATGTIVGAAAGALLGNHIAKNRARCH
ncbi:MAG: glycine zipper 2TM domain-containing protein [Sphingomonadales bacterium]|nr:glycine zipper 2TM domain-containing protein [Sphingomonadales bacterium]